MITKTCETCQQPFTIDDEGCTDIGRSILTMKRYCEPCLDAIGKASSEAERQREREKLDNRWAEICPPLYRETDFAHPGILPSFFTAAGEWCPGIPQGLGFMGNSGGGKTRLLFWCLQRAFEAGKRVEATSHHAFGRIVMDAFSSPNEERRERANQSLDRFSKVDVLLLDDLGKAPSTERCDAELENLIETRGAHLRPILWSANGHGQWLIDRFGPDRGSPIVRRLAEFSTVVKA